MLLLLIILSMAKIFPPTVAKQVLCGLFCTVLQKACIWYHNLKSFKFSCFCSLPNQLAWSVYRVWEFDNLWNGSRVQVLFKLLPQHSPTLKFCIKTRSSISLALFKLIQINKCWTCWTCFSLCTASMLSVFKLYICSI